MINPLDNYLLSFDEVEHRYWLGPLELPGVTRILDRFLCDFSMVDDNVLERARVLGSQVHTATALDDQGILDEDDLNDNLPHIVPYLRGWRNFKQDMGFIPTLIERRGVNNALKYAGTLDRVGYLHNSVEGPQVLIDIKRSDALYPSVGPQTAAYQKLDIFGTTPPARRACVRVFEDGYKFDWLHDPSDWSTFVSCLTLYNFQLKNRRHFSGIN